MALTIKGDVRQTYSEGVSLLPDYSLTEKNDGTIEGQVVFECDDRLIDNLPRMGSPHPRDRRCELYDIETTFLGLNKVRMTGSYFGLVAPKTKPTISYTPNTNQEPITSHPNFLTKLMPAGGVWRDDETNEFIDANSYLALDEEDRKNLEFVGWTNPKDELFGVEYYLTPAALVSLTYWTRSVPLLSKQMIIKKNIPGFKSPPGVKEFLLMDSPYRQVGNFYQVTENYMGSGEKGFSRLIYGE